jgi:hypothetical protein
MMDNGPAVGRRRRCWLSRGGASVNPDPAVSRPEGVESTCLEQLVCLALMIFFDAKTVTIPEPGPRHRLIPRRRRRGRP